MKKLPLTIVTAVLNESKILPGFLGHVCNFAEEIIIVVDYRNTDNSADIARKYGCKVIRDSGKSAGIVFNNKNLGASMAKHSWVLILDADERMDDTIKDEIAKVVSPESQRTANIYQTSFINYEFGKFFTSCDQKYKPFVRLFRKGSFSYKTAQTAEGFDIQTTALAPSPLGKFMLKIPLLRSLYLRSDPNLKTLKGHLIHNSHPDIEDFVKKIDRYSTREAGILFTQNKNRPTRYFVTNLISAPLKEFFYKFLIWRMYKEGLHGFVASSIYAFYHFLVYAKYFALTYKKDKAKEIEKIERKHGFTEL